LCVADRSPRGVWRQSRAEEFDGDKGHRKQERPGSSAGRGSIPRGAIDRKGQHQRERRPQNDEKEAGDAASISFQHQPDDVAGFERAPGCPVRAGASWNGVVIEASICRLPMRRRDPILRKFLESQADAVLASTPARPGVALDVQRALTSRIAGGATRMSEIARQLGMSERTLHRRLAEEGASYQELVEQVRKAAAGRYLDESTLAIGEIAYLLGYSEPAAFHRAFKRWYATTPEHFRARTR